MLTGLGDASSARFQNCLRLMSYCRGVRDFVDMRDVESGAGAEAVGCLIYFFFFFFPGDNRSYTEGGFFLRRLEKPLSCSRDIQSGSGGAELTAACRRRRSCERARPYTCTHAGRAVTQQKIRQKGNGGDAGRQLLEERKGRQGVKKKKKGTHNTSATIHFICRAECCGRTTRSEI